MYSYRRRKLPYYLVIICFLITSSLLISCQPEEPIKIDKPKNFDEVFELFWNGMNSNYVYWDMDSTDWDAMYSRYKFLFSQLDLNNPIDINTSVEYLREMTKGIIDGHFSIKFLNIYVENLTINPLLERRQRSEALRYPYAFLLCDTIYLDSGFKLGFDYANSIFNIPLISVCGTINNEIIYFSCNFFALTKSYESNVTSDVKETLQYFFDLLDNVPPHIRGIIIDVRGNPGGDLVDLNFLLGRLIDKPLHIGFCQYKSNYGRLDFTPWIKAYVNPSSGSHKIQLPVVVLADKFSASLSESIVMAVRSMPNGIFIGENTWGATGPIIDNAVYNSGTFDIKDFMQVQTSSCKFKYLDNQIFESTGIMPDVFIPFSSLVLSSGHDLQIEKAINVIKDQ